MPKLSVAIPVYNESTSLPALRDQLLSSLEQLANCWEIVFVNDGSTDQSPQVLDDCARADSRIKVVHLRRNFGQTAALMAAIDHSDGDIIITMDSDLQNDPKDIPRLIAKLEEGYDVVSGWRVDRQDTEWGRRLPSKVANRLIARISRVNIHDFGCTLKAYRRWTIENARLYGEMHRYIPIYASWEGARITELPVLHHPRAHGTSKYGLSRITRVMLDLLVIIFLDRTMDRPMQFYGRAGVYLMAAALLVGLYALELRLVENVSFILTPLPLLFSLLAISALLCVFFGMIAEIQMRTYFESRDRRAYVVREKRNLD